MSEEKFKMECDTCSGREKESKVDNRYVMYKGKYVEISLGQRDMTIQRSG